MGVAFVPAVFPDCFDYCSVVVAEADSYPVAVGVHRGRVSLLGIGVDDYVDDRVGAGVGGQVNSVLLAHG